MNNPDNFLYYGFCPNCEQEHRLLLKECEVFLCDDCKTEFEKGTSIYGDKNIISLVITMLEFVDFNKLEYFSNGLEYDFKEFFKLKENDFVDTKDYVIAFYDNNIVEINLKKYLNLPHSTCYTNYENLMLNRIRETNKIKGLTIYLRNV